MHRLKNQRGQAMVEFALILPILLLLVIGVYDFGSAENRKNDLNFVANTAARYAEVNACAACSSGQTINDYVANSADFSPKPTITMCYPNTTHAVGDPLKVTASSQYQFLVGPTLKGLPVGFIKLTSTVTVRILTDPGSTPPLYTTTSC